MLGLRFCARAFSSCGEWGPLFIVVRGPVTIAASLVAEQRLQTLRLSSCGSRAQLLRGMWDPPRPGPEPASPALAGRFSTTAPPGKPQYVLFLRGHISQKQFKQFSDSAITKLLPFPCSHYGHNYFLTLRAMWMTNRCTIKTYPCLILAISNLHEWIHEKTQLLAPLI